MRGPENERKSVEIVNPPEFGGWLVQNGREGTGKVWKIENKTFFFLGLKRPENGGWLVQFRREGTGKSTENRK